MLSQWEMTARLLLAAALGSAIGFERERLLWAAGIRTHMLVCVGACLVMLVSAFGFADVLAAQHVVLDPSRVAAQVVSGIGFLGAGSIIARGEVVRGLTTAASVWTVAAIGLAVGGGLYFAAAVSTAVILAILAGVKPLEEAYRARNQGCHLTIRAARGQMTPEALQRLLHLRGGQVKRFIATPSGDTGLDEVRVTLAKVSAQDMARFPEVLRAAPGIHGVEAARKPGLTRQPAA